MTESNRVKLALIGCGNIAKAHWRGIQAHAPHIEVTAVVDINADLADEMAQRTASQAFNSLEQALAMGDFTAVDIMLPHHLHEAVALHAFAAGKHVVLEKPMAPTLVSCKRIMDAAAKAGTVFMVAEQSQYWLDALKVQQLIHAGKLGEIITARAYFSGAAKSGSTGLTAWRYELAKAGGGICIDGGAHWIRPLRMWLGEIAEVIAVTDRPFAEMEGESLVRSLIRFESGVVAAFDALHAGQFIGPGEEFRVTGTGGEIVIERGPSGRVLLYNKEYPTGQVLMTKQDGRWASFGYELHDFSEAVLRGKNLEAGPAYSLGELRTALAIYRSAASRQWESVWD